MYDLTAAPVSLISIFLIRIFAPSSAVWGIIILGGLLTTFKYIFCTNFTKPWFFKIDIFFLLKI